MLSNPSLIPFSGTTRINDTESPAITLPLSAHPCVEVSVGVIRSLVDGWADNGRSVVAPMDGVISLWVHGKSPHTQRYYRREATKFLAMVGKPLDLVVLADVQAYVTMLEKSDLAASSQARAIAAIKSLFSFAHGKTGLIRANPAGPVTVPKVKDALAERILSESVVQMMIGLEPDPRNQLLLKLLYITGVRVSELTSLEWGSLQAREVGGQVLVYGKGNKTQYGSVKPKTR